MNWAINILRQLVLRVANSVFGKSFSQPTQSTAGIGEEGTAEFVRLSGKGDSRGWRFNREEIHGRSTSE